MAIVRWNPFRELESFQRRMNRLFEDEFGRAPAKENELYACDWTPSVDIFEDKENVVLTAEVPGLSKEEIDIQVSDNQLTIRGERKMEHEESKEGYRRVERCYGTFSRSFNLPDTIDQENIQAAYEEGVLKVTLPKMEKAKPRQIDVDVK